MTRSSVSTTMSTCASLCEHSMNRHTWVQQVISFHERKCNPCVCMHTTGHAKSQASCHARKLLHMQNKEMRHHACCSSTAASAACISAGLWTPVYPAALKRLCITIVMGASLLFGTCQEKEEKEQEEEIEEEEEGFYKLLPANKADHLCHRIARAKGVLICPRREAAGSKTKQLKHCTR